MQRIYIVGNPNSGKTTLFNKLTNSFEHTGNYSGVTVESKQKQVVVNGKEYSVIDLAGVYSLTPFSLEEKTTADCLFSELDREDCLVLNLCESGAINRSLNLTLELLEAGFKVLMVVNNKSGKMCHNKRQNNNIKSCPKNASTANRKLGENSVTKRDLNCPQGVEVPYYRKISETLGINVVGINARADTDYNFIFSPQNYKRSHKLPYINKYANAMPNFNAIVPIKLCEKDSNIAKILNIIPEVADRTTAKLRQCGLDLSAILSDRLEVINTLKTKPKESKLTQNLDRIFLNKFLAVPLFLLVMLTIFYLTFSSVGGYITSVFDALICVHFYNLIQNLLAVLGTNAIFNDFILTAIIEGVGSLLCFLPQIVLLFLFITLLEDSGYLPRLAFLLDDLLAKFGLSGKSLFTFIMSFGCSTTAMLTAKNLDSTNAKIKTMLLSQYMTCSAKLPIITVLCATFFTGNVLMIFAFYLIGILISMIASIILQNSHLKTADNTFMLEMPAYNLPKLSKLVRVAFKQGTEFLVRIGGVVLLFMAVIWLLENFNYKLQFVNNSQDSLLYMLGSFIAPIFAPLGFNNWGVASALIVGLVAKEIIVSTISMLNHTVDNLGGLMTSLVTASSVVTFTQASALSFMTFVLLYAPCISSLSLIKRELGGKYLTLAVVMQFAFAYASAFFVYTFALLFQSGMLTILFTILVMLAVVLFCLSKGYKTPCCACPKYCTSCCDLSCAKCTKKNIL